MSARRCRHCGQAIWACWPILWRSTALAVLEHVLWWVGLHRLAKHVERIP